MNTHSAVVGSFSSTDKSPLVAQQYINGTWHVGDAGRTATSFNPVDYSAVGTFSDGTVADARAAIAAAKAAFNSSSWASDPRTRQLVMLRWADRLERSAELVGKLISMENGKPLSHSMREVAGAVSEIRYYAGACRHIAGTAQEVAPHVLSVVTREPSGVVGVIVPWNAPCTLFVRSLAPALAAGCAAVIKPAPQTPLLSCEIARALVTDDALPAGIVNFVTETGSDIAKCMVESPDVDVISFTGSTAVGKQIASAAAASLKRLCLELGGKACCLVFADCDVQRVAKSIATAATIIAGQQCTAARRVLVERAVLPAMERALSTALSSLKVGDGMTPGTEMGPLIDWKARDQVVARTNQAFDSCDKVLLRGGVPEGAQYQKGSFLLPSLIEDESDSKFFSQEEIFGPLVVMEPFDSESEAVAKSNSSVYGLASSVWTENLGRALRVSRALRKGTVWINDHNKLFAEAEAGGYRHSGKGPMHGFSAVFQYMETKHIYNDFCTLS